MNRDEEVFAIRAMSDENSCASNRSLTGILQLSGVAYSPETLTRSEVN
jgi:hypothetical protein